jgi:hypothetical protein
MKTLVLLGSVLLAASPMTRAAEPATPDLAQLQAMSARFEPVEIKVDTSKLPPNERLALGKMIEAAKIFDALFLRQRSPMNETLLAELVRDESPLGRARLSYFRLNAGPWSDLDEDKPFVPGAAPKPPAGNFYPADADSRRNRLVDENAAPRAARGRDRVFLHSASLSDSGTHAGAL